MLSARDRKISGRLLSPSLALDVKGLMMPQRVTESWNYNRDCSGIHNAAVAFEEIASKCLIVSMHNFIRMKQVFNSYFSTTRQLYQ